VDQSGIADYGPWITKSHAVRVFSVGQKYHDFSKKNLRNSRASGINKSKIFEDGWGEKLMRQFHT
jgi:hypothetical protein